MLLLLLFAWSFLAKREIKPLFECPGIWSCAVLRLPFVVVVVVVDQSIVREVAK